MTKETCSERIKKGLIMRDMKQIELCELTKIPKSAMSQYIKGTFEPKQDRVWSIAKALNVTETWLMGYDENLSENTPPHITLSETELQIIETYRELNEEGQERAKTYIEDLVDTGKYKKSTQHKLEEKQA